MAEVQQRHIDAAKLELWGSFCERHAIVESAVPLFACHRHGAVETRRYGKDSRLILVRSPQMEGLVIGEVRKVLAEGSRFEGILYLMLWLDGRRVLPLYVGRAGKFGRGDGNVSANLLNIERNVGKFARWGSNYAYHIGDLSAVVCPGHDPSKVIPKYRRWADQLFEPARGGRQVLRRPVYFWCTAWSADSPSIWPEFGATSLAFEEYLLIGVASLLFPETLLNREGVNLSGPR